MSWQQVELSDVCTLLTDGTHYTPPDIGEGIPFLTVKDVSDKGLDFESCSKISLEEYTKADLGNSAPKIGDVLFSKDGTVGKVHVVSESREFAVLSSLAILRPFDGLDSNYLAHVMRNPITLRQANKNKTGSALRRIILSDIKKLKIPLPPLDEQKRIAAILDKADAIRRKRQQAIDLADDFLRSVFLDMFGDPVTNPKGWEVKPLNSFVSKLGDGLHGTPSYDPEGEYFFVNGNNLIDGKIVTNESTKKVNEAEFQKHKKELNSNTMLVSINGTIGKIAFYNEEKVVLGKSACYFNLIPESISSVYLYYLIQSHYFLHYVSSVVTGSTIKNVSLKSMREMPIPLPHKNLQDKFENIVKKAKELKVKHQNSNQNSDDSFKSLSQKAFAGEL